jgi:hypothetical protein
MNRYLMMFLKLGAIMAISMSLIYSIGYGFPAGLIAGVVGGFLFSGVMTGVIVIIHRMTAAKVSRPGADPTAVNQMRTIVLPMSFEDAFDICESSVQAVKGLNIKATNKQQGTIIARTSVTWKSFGEDIVYSLSQTDSSETVVRLSSKPLLATTLADYGKNFDNVEKIQSYLRSGVR